MNRKIIRLTAALAASAMLAAGGCGLLPEEEVAPTPPVLYAYEKVEYTMAEVTRGDIVATTKVTFRYKPTRQEMISFDVNGAALSGIYVAVGDNVEAGALLAELDDEGLAEQIESQREVIAGYERTLASMKEDLDLELEGYDIRIAADPENEGLADARAAAVENYNVERETVDLRLSVAETKLSELEEASERRRLYAPIDGTVTYIKAVDPSNFSSVAGEVFMTISDKSTLAFSADDSKAQGLFAVGDEVEININGDLYPSVITAAEGKTASLEPVDHIANIDESSYGTVTIVTEGVYDVLCVPSSAVKSANGQPIVYILKDGVRTLHEVEVGFSTNGVTEIVSGLEEGEQVIAK